MNISYEEIIKTACHLENIEFEGKKIICINKPVDSASGSETEIDLSPLKGMSINAIAETLLKFYSGDIIFIITDKNRFAVVRPPFSELNVYYKKKQSTVHLWTGYHTPDHILKEPISFNLNYLSGWLTNPAWCIPDTGLTDVYELLSGSILFFDEKNLFQKDYLSEIISLLRTNLHIDFNHTTERVHELIINSTRHKINQYKESYSICCSGGLDSSVVTLAAKSIAKKWPIPLLNCYSEENQLENERYYFNLINKCVGAHTCEIKLDKLTSRTSLYPELLAPSPRPCKMSAAIGVQANIYKMAMHNGSKMILTGDGGDQLFLRLRQPFIAKELLAEGTSLKMIFSYFSYLAVLKRSSIWPILYDSFIGKSKKMYKQHLLGNMCFQESDFFNFPPPKDSIFIPDSHTLDSLATTRLFQFIGMRNAEFNHIAVRNYNIEERKVFMFWPLIKTALQTSRSFHMLNGTDRAVERHAFIKELPKEIFNRTSKGGSQNILTRYDYNFFAKSLLNSKVVKYGLINNRSLMNFIDHNSDIYDSCALIRIKALDDWMNLYA